MVAFRDIVAALVKVLGVGGFFTLCILLIIVKFSSENQRIEIIDKYVLFKDTDRPHLYSTIVIVVLIISLIMQKIFNDWRVKLLQEQIDVLNKQIFKK